MCVWRLLELQANWTFITFNWQMEELNPAETLALFGCCVCVWVCVWGGGRGEADVIAPEHSINGIVLTLVRSDLKTCLERKAHLPT